MPESTVLDSVFGALGSMASASDRRAREGLEAAQAEEIALKNVATKKVHEAYDASQVMGQISARGFGKFNAETRAWDMDMEKMATTDPELFSQFIGGKGMDRWLNHTDPKTGKTTQLAFSRMVKVPAGMAGPAAPTAAPLAMGELPTVAQQTGGEAPAQYMMLLKNEKGEEVPATQMGTKDPSDPLMTFSKDQLSEMGQKASARFQALGAMGNDVTMGKLGAELTDFVRAKIEEKLLDSGGEGLDDFDAAARREFALAIGGADTQEELEEMARIGGFDPAQLRKEAEEEWLSAHKKATQAATIRGQGNPEDLTNYRDTKANLTRLVDQAETALKDYDARRGVKPQVEFSNPMARTPYPMRPYEGSREPKKPDNTAERQKLVAARNDAAAKLTALQPPRAVKAMPEGVEPPPFEFTTENLRKSILGELEQPTPEQSAALAKYGQSVGIKKASDLSKIPSEKADALIWAMVTNSRGTSEDKMKLFDSLNSYKETGDPNRSAMDAVFDTAGARAQTAQAQANLDSVDVARQNNIMDYTAAIRGQNIDLEKIAWDRSKYSQSLLNDIDAKTLEVDKRLDTIYEDVLEKDGLTFKESGPSPKSRAAYGALENMVSTLAPTSPLRVAAAGRYLEATMTLAAANMMKPGAVAWWDGEKWFKNTFLREKGMINMSSLIESFRVTKWKNGKPETVSFTEGGARGDKPTEGLTVGMAEWSRFLGTSKTNEVIDAMYFQKAANALGGSSDAEAIMAKSLELKKADGYDLPY